MLEVSPTISDYYYWMVKKHLQLPKLNKPFNSPHVTVVAGKYEDATQNLLWGKHQGRNIDIAYNSFVEQHDTYFWLEVVSTDLMEIRRELGLTDTPKHPYHITIANLKNLTNENRD